ncbi:anti-sigma regulatory factor (Ser/Thr protein kinase) [Azospirillum fermentarium]|uniref:ATP-binding protein n=1 Tax=Azospirillum fermentarium TaxID=1233114 RepID=UPI0022266453|nr:ATP-binding protein [Azospirillum fermentarium]MCW2248636.1 anti-sigma regulatory factor (Ser/Thr protein kinase) [Azospirillum fermentarium]
MLPAHCHTRLRIDDPSALTLARGLAADLATAQALGEDAAARLALVVSELGSNLLHHTPEGGNLLLRPLAAGLDGAAPGVECVALDHGPGIADVGRAIAGPSHPPGVVPASGLGYGLGAVRRLSDLFDIHTRPGLGTAVLTRITAHGPGNPAGLSPPAAFWGGAMLAMGGGDWCGDGWLVRGDGLVLAVDGLGHGEAASAAARQAETVAAAAPGGADPGAVLAALHGALRGTRGAVALVLRLEPDRIGYAGVGNITAALVRPGGAAALTGRWGVVGYNAAPPPTAWLSWQAGDHVVVHSDGCSRLADLFTERHLLHTHPALAAAVLMRDGCARVDDQMVMVLRHPASL